MLRAITTAVLAAGFLYAAAPPHPVQPLPKWEGRVSVSVGIDDTQLANEITSHVTRELRSLGDIVVTDAEADWVFRIIAERLVVSGRDSGVALSFVITCPAMPRRVLDAFLKGRIEETALDTFARYYGDAERILKYGLQVGGKDAIPRSAREIVADFDVTVLKTTREGYETLIRRHAKPPSE